MTSYMFIGNRHPIYKLDVWKSDTQEKYGLWSYKVWSYKDDKLLFAPDHLYASKHGATEAGFGHILEYEGEVI